MRQSQALYVMLSGASVFLTGAPGAGKTYVLNEFVRRAEKRGLRVAVTASTGIAATHIGGATLHSWSGLGIREALSQFDKDVLSTNKTLRNRYLNTDVLVIDEVSMLHGRRLDMLNELAKAMRDDPRPFGGLQVILVGDLFQLPPVDREGGPADFVHLSQAWQELNPQVCYITEQHRQAGDRLLDVLQAMRQGELEDWHAQALQERLNIKPPTGVAITRLYSHKIDVDGINQRHLASLAGEAHRTQMFTYGASAKVEQLKRSVLAPEILDLKLGAEVMFVANDFGKGYVNGSRGQVVGFQAELPQVQLQNGRVVTVEPHSWAIVEDGKKRAEVTQLPLRLAWAITIHKSQGMSLDAAEIDLSRSFTPGMGYVALSRVRSLDGIYLTGMNAMAMRLHPDIFDFDTTIRAASELLAATTPDASDQEERVSEPAKPEAHVDPLLLEKLKAWRLRRARTDGVPAYIVAHDSLLEALATHPPQSPNQLAVVPGIGPRKLALYGPEILRLTVS